MGVCPTISALLSAFVVVSIHNTWTSCDRVKTLCACSKTRLVTSQPYFSTTSSFMFSRHVFDFVDCHIHGISRNIDDASFSESTDVLSRVFALLPKIVAKK